MSVNLPWLPNASEEDDSSLIELLSVLRTGEADVGAYASLFALSGRKWKPAKVRSTAKEIVDIIADDTKSALAREAGLVKISVLIISSLTMVHARDDLITAALRHGVILDLHIEEYRDPESVIASINRRFDAVLFMLDHRSLGLKPNIDGSDNADHWVEDALARLNSLANECVRTTAPLAIFQTLPNAWESYQSQIDFGLAGSLRRMTTLYNLGLGKLVRSNGHLLLDLASIASDLGREAWRAGRYAHLAKLPFSHLATEYVADSIGRILSARMGRSRRVLVLDLDNTLWGGVIGDDGMEGIHMSPGHPSGEAHLAIQNMAMEAYHRGILLCISSKNTHDVAIEAFRSHPDMLIPESAISLFRINWQDKASNIRDMAKSLNLGLDAFVFVDDNPAERMLVRTELPQVAVPELPKDPADWPHVLSMAGYFDQISVTSEDLQRGQLYASNAKRQEALEDASDLETYLKSLSMELYYRPFDAMGRSRIAQLIAKSNQYNLTTRRYSESEVAQLETDENAITLQFRLKDRFGDNGMIAAIIGKANGDELSIDLWIMSCRVLSRRVEQASLNLLVEAARQKGINRILGHYIPTPKNHIVKDHYRDLGFEQCADFADGSTTWQLNLDTFTHLDVPVNCIIG